MRKINRFLLSGTLLALAAMSVLALTFVGSRAEGPLSRMLGRLGSAVSRTESRVAFHIRGPGRASELQWFDPMRRSRDRMVQPDSVLLGAYDNGLPTSFDGLIRLETVLGNPMPIVHVFTAWGDLPEHQFPRKFVETASQIRSVAMITWEPWLSTFGTSRDLPPADERDLGGMAAVARGDYDFYLESWFRDAATFAEPLFLRFGHEMNDAYRYAWGPHNNRPDEYIAAFRHVVETARRVGALNIIWVWSPHIAYDGFEDYYPGDDAVDWVAATVLNYGNIAYWSQWWTFDDILTRKYDRLAAHQKPIMIAEMGTLMAGGERAPWFEQALSRLPRRLPEVKAIIFFHNRSDATITYQALNWAFDHDEDVIAAIKRALGTWNAPSGTLPTGAGTGDAL